MLYNYFDNETISEYCYYEDTKQDILRYYAEEIEYLKYDIKLNILKALTLEYASNKYLQIKMFKLLKSQLKQKVKTTLRNNINN